ncbi:hypothetical protein GQ600_22126 [Phytophthora cactorum]|nr:hypothetical protein GQ600_22126 [Phytophthora cactorum]
MRERNFRSCSEKLKTWFTSSKVTPKSFRVGLTKGNRQKRCSRACSSPRRGPGCSRFPVSYLASIRRRSECQDLSERNVRNLGADSALQADQVQHWVAIRKDPDEVFHLFKLDKVKRNILSNPEFTAWFKYVDDVTPNIRRARVNDPTLRKYFNDDTLLELTATAKRTEKQKHRYKVEDDLLQVWLGSRKTPDEALVELVLSDDEWHFGEPLVQHFGQFGYAEVAKMLTAAKTTDATKNIATKLESAQLKLWQSTGKSADDVFELLKLYRTDHDFSTTRFYARGSRAWFHPLRINYQWDAVDQMIEKAMQNPSTAKIAKMAESAWLKQWLDREKSPSKPSAPEPQNAGEQTLASPKFKTWAKYLNDFNQRYPDRKETMIDGIRANYIDIKLIPMLYAAQKDPRTKKLAINLQNALVNKWLVAKEKPADLTWRFSTVQMPGNDTAICQETRCNVGKSPI